MVTFKFPSQVVNLFLTVLIIFVFVYSQIGCQTQKPAVPPEKIAIAYSTANAVLVHIAFAKGYFTEEGLDATPQTHAFGKLCLQSAIEGKADLATAADTAIMFAVMDGKKIMILSTIHLSNRNEAIVARQDRGIAKPSDLKGKTIGVTPGTTSEFFADSFLTAHGINRKQVRIVKLTPDEMAEALNTGKVDAIATWNPNIMQLRKKLGSKGRIFYDETLYTEHFCVTARQDFVKKHPAAIKKVLRALMKAETFVLRHPEEARRLVATFTKTDKSILDETWDVFNFRVTLDQALLVNLEDQTRWAMTHQLTARKDMPNYLDFIYIEGLQAVKPEAVRIIR